MPQTPSAPPARRPASELATPPQMPTEAIAEAKRSNFGAAATASRRPKYCEKVVAARRKKSAPLGVDALGNCNCPTRCFCNECPDAKQVEAKAACGALETRFHGATNVVLMRVIRYCTTGENERGKKGG